MTSVEHLPLTASLSMRAIRLFFVGLCAALVAACGSGGGGGGGGAGVGGSAITPPIIVAQPAAVNVSDGQSASFTVIAVGTAPIAYQWQRGGVAIAGATAATFTIPVVLLSDSGAVFTVVVSNAAGSAQSQPATLTVVLPMRSVSLLAGNIGGPGTIDGTAGTARFLSPAGAALDGSGNLYLTDSNTIRKVSAAGVVTTFAGMPNKAGSADGTGAAASFNSPIGVAVDGSGNVYVADSLNNTIRKITPAGLVTTVAGRAGVVGASDGSALNALFNTPAGVAVDGAGNLYVSDTGNQTIRKISNSGIVTTLAGSAGVAGSSDGTGSAAMFNRPAQIAVAGSSNIFVADSGNNTIRMLTQAGVVTTLAGSPGAPGATDGTGRAASFNAPTGIALDGAGNVYVGDGRNETIRKISPAGVVTTLAGTPGRTGSADGTGSAALFSNPFGLASDASGTLYVTDRDNDTVRKVTAGGVVTTLAGAPKIQGSIDATGAAASFNVPIGVAVDAAANVYVADYFNSTIRKITPSGVVTTLAGAPGQSGSADGVGGAARFVTPRDLAVDGAGNVYVADKTSNTIRKITPAGSVTTLAGSPGVSGSADGIGAAATFNQPTAIAVNASGDLYVADNNSVIRKISAAGVVTTFAGAAGRVGSSDGPGNVASFRFAQGLAVDAAGNLYVADSGNDLIRRVDTGGFVTTVAGAAGIAGSTDGPAASARFSFPTDVVVDRAGNVFVTDYFSSTIRKIDTAGNVTTVAGIADGRRGVRLGALPGHFDLPAAIAIDSAGNLYVTDANGVLRITLQ